MHLYFDKSCVLNVSTDTKLFSNNRFLNPDSIMTTAVEVEAQVEAQVEATYTLSINYLWIISKFCVDKNRIYLATFVNTCYKIII